MDCLGARASFLQLQMSYRSTAEITAFSNEVARAMDQPLATSVGRHGASVERYFCTAEQQNACLSRLIEKMRSGGMRTIAVITRTAKQADALAKQLSILQRLDPARDQLQAGVWCCCAAEVKGLEFDAVLLPDILQYGNDPASLRLLYVAATRPLHQLLCVCPGKWPPYLAGCLSASEKGEWNPDDEYYKVP